MAISALEVPRLYEMLKQYHGQRINNARRWQQYYDQDPTVVRHLVAGGLRLFRSSLATEVVDAIADRVRTDEPEVRFRHRAASEPAREHAILMERLGRQVLRADMERGEVDPYAQAVRDMALRGECVIKRLHDPERPPEPVKSQTEDYEKALAEWEARTAAGWPLMPARPVDPLTFFLPPNATYPYAYAVELQTRRSGELKGKYPDWWTKVLKDGTRKNGQTVKLTDTQIQDAQRAVEWLEYWSPDQYIVVADGVEVENLSKKNPYGVVPYVHSYSGLGRIDDESAPAEKASSIIGKIEGELEADLVLKSVQFALAQLYVLPRILAPDDMVQEVAAALGEGGVVPYRKADGPTSVQWLPSPPLNEAVSQFLAAAHSAIARRVNPILRGMPADNPASGVQEALRIAAADSGGSDIYTAANWVLTRSLNLALAILKTTDATVNVLGGMTTGDRSKERIARASKGDFDDQNFECVFKAFDPIEDTRRQQNGLTLLRERAITRRTMRKSFLPGLIVDPDEEEDQEMVEKANDAWLASPQFQAWSVQTHMGEEAVAAEQAALQQSGKAEPSAPASPNGTVTPEARENMAMEIERMAGGGMDVNGAAQAAQGPLTQARNIAAGA